MALASRPRACARCRRQKLRCDAEKPCTMCLRAGFECQRRKSSSPPAARRRRHRGGGQRDASVNSASRVPTTAPTSSNSTALASTSSAMRFATRLLGADGSSVANDRLHVLVGDAPQSSERTAWALKSLDRLPLPVLEALVAIYFSRANGLMLLLHESSLCERMRTLWQMPEWQRQDAGAVLVALVVAALGVHCAIDDASWSGREVVDRHGVNLAALAPMIAEEASSHLLDILVDCSVESVQLCILLARYYTFAGHPDRSWPLIGMAARNAYAAGLHLQPPFQDNTIQSEVRRRAWLTVRMTDTFSALFSGRPPSLDISPPWHTDPQHMDDIDLPPNLASHPLLANINMATFHRLKYELYEIMSHTLATFRQIRHAENLSPLVQNLRDTEIALARWRLRLPPFFNYDTWDNDDPLRYQHSPSSHARILTLQSITLQVIFDSTVIMLHRPILELAVGDCPSVLLPLDVIADSRDAAIAAALRMSRIPLDMFENELHIAYILMACLTAGVILCLPPVQEPMSARAYESKAGILRIVHGCWKFCARTALARHIHGLLSSLLLTIVQRETTAALDDSRRATTAAATAPHSAVDAHNAHQSNGKNSCSQRQSLPTVDSGEHPQSQQEVLEVGTYNVAAMEWPGLAWKWQDWQDW